LSVYNIEGLRGLYAGSTPALLVNCAENSVLFGMRTSTTAITAALLKQDKNNVSNFGQAIAGSAAAFFSSIVVCPTEMIKARMQSAQELQRTGKFNFSGKVTIFSTSKQILSEGYTAPFRGLVGTWGREMPGYFVLFYAYAKNRELISHYTRMNETLNAALSGGLAGGAYWLAMMPIDVIKTRQQVLSIGSKDAIKFTDCIKDIYKTSGGRGFYAGLLPMIIRTIPANGTMFALIEASDPLINRLIS